MLSLNTIISSTEPPPSSFSPHPSYIYNLNSRLFLSSPTSLPWSFYHPCPSLSLMGTWHQTHEKGSGSFFFFFPLRQNEFGTWWFGGVTAAAWVRGGGHHLSPSSVLLNMRMALEILRAGPSLMLMIFTMSVWVSSRKASPSIIWRHTPDVIVIIVIFIVILIIIITILIIHYIMLLLLLIIRRMYMV